MFSGSRTSVVTLSMLAALLVVVTACGSNGAGTAGGPSSGTSSDTASDPVSPAATQSPDASTPAAGESPTATSSLPSTDDPTEAVVLPTCDSVWVQGQKFPHNYQGCLLGTETVQADGLYCEFGKPLFTYAKRYYAVENGPVNRTEQVLAKDKTFQSAQRKCGG